MTKLELKSLLKNLISTWENEIIEFKQAEKDFKTDDIGKYFSALSNEARLLDNNTAWLVFGVNNKTREVVGTDYRSNSDENLTLDKLKYQIQQNTNPSTTFRHIYEFDDEGKRVILFEIPAAPLGIPIAWKGHFYSRAGESLTALSIDKLDQLRNVEDWSAKIVPEASLKDLDESAIQVAKSAFIEKFSNRFPAEEVNAWDLQTFLDKAKLTQNGRITRTTLLLLGKSESAFFLSPHPAQLTWKLSTKDENAYEHFSIPFLLNSTELYRKIRNFQIRLLPQNSLLAKEISKYDQKIVLEALHNCIAHQDYLLNSRILVTEKTDRLIFENAGNFLEGTPTDYIDGTKTPKKYRNAFLAQAMVQLNMIDTMGYGIYEMHQKQAKRYLPLPDYDISQRNSVKLTLYGDVVNEAYTTRLIMDTDIAFNDICALDRVQKKLPIDNEAAKKLRKQGLIEGRKPNYIVSAVVQKSYPIPDKVKYIHKKAQDSDFYQKLIIDYLTQFEEADRSTINELLLSKLSDDLSAVQKDKKIANLLTQLRRKELIQNVGTKTKPIWKLVKV
ncbi:RNA-binding domain-containing protein [Rodentibacter trehalosifermentans]|uniref:RNA-binding domain-containing protein n=1 Tax=Rodentibacter trehalosifermentans TaxID=1908263 RepID=UPI0009851CB6|nr:RNA-binding domain-containing protein [Rodentibacter trehalosifermentans]OOF51655.1 transcriptional regulator [Rodentibacter trehalosifermentans]